MKKILLNILIILYPLLTFGQGIVHDVVLDSYSNQSTIQASYSITLKNGFYIPSGNPVQIFIGGIPTMIAKPNTNQNYIMTRVFRDSVKVNKVNDIRAIDKENRIIEYFDGLGRPSQTVQLMASPSYYDIVQHMEYDVYGRETAKYLPYVKSGAKDGSFKMTAKADQLAYYTSVWDAAVVKTTKPFAVSVYEPSPLNRITEQGAEGDAWQPVANRGTVVRTSTAGHTVVAEYGSNGLNEVRDWVINANDRSADGSKFYSEGKLYKTVTKDENWIADSVKSGTIEEFKDIFDRIIVKRVWVSKTKALNTQYIYDDFGNLRYVIPPGYTDLALSEGEMTFKELIYAYHYDKKQRLIEKKIPGKGWEWLVYNSNDQVILTQDSVQRGLNKWNYTKYDAFGRIVQTGIYSKAFATQAAAQSDANTVTASWEDRIGNTYTNQTYPTTSQARLTVNYYDDYSFSGGNTTNLQPSGINKSIMTHGLPTGSMVWKDDRTDSMLTILYYDDNGRLSQSVNRNHLNGTDRLTNEYNFSGDVVKNTRIHTPGAGAATTIVTAFDYDHVGRLTRTKKKVNSQAEIIQSRLSYNEIGQVKSRDLHSENSGANFMTNIIYSYNERGWQTKTISPQFTSQLNYNMNGTTVLNNAQYNGNIAQQLWGYAPTTSSTFTYDYDALNRLKSGVSTGTVMSEALTYDDMGNIKTLIRDGGAPINYTYTNSNKSNRLANLSGGISGTFIYDGNGNATKDRTGMVLSYNHLNLPKTVTGTGKNIIYTYDASGTKLNLKSTVGGITTEQDYIGGIEYSKASGANPVIERIATEDGFLLNSSGTYSYYYNLTDHLGNVRVVLKKDGTSTVPVATVMQKQDYYPFGKTKSIATSINNKYLYNGKEMQTDLNGGTHTLGGSYVLEGQLDYGARFYDAEIARFNVIDRFAEKYYNMTTYQYGGLDPIKHIDVNGDSLFITRRTGFLGLGKKQTLRYEDGKLYNQDGSAYSGKVNGFLRLAVSNLDKIGSQSVGKGLLNEIESSTSNVTIVSGYNGNKFSTGTNTVTFDPNSGEGGLNTRGSRDRPAFIGLGHELAHGLDNIRGTLNNSTIPGQDFSYAEHFATHMENQMRSEHFLPLREYYKFNVQTGVGIYPLIDGSGRSLYYNNYNYNKQHGFGSGVNSRGILPSILLTPIKNIKIPNVR